MTKGLKVATSRNLRAFRYDPPGYAKAGARRTTFQSALEQSEQFLTAARDAGYATRPVQLFYGMSQAGRAIIAASPRIGNQAWAVTGHGLSATRTKVGIAADVTVAASRDGLFPAVATALGVDALVPGEHIALRELWPLLPETATITLSADPMLPVLLFLQGGWPRTGPFSGAEVCWIPRQVKELFGKDPARVKDHLDHYPALRGSRLRTSQPMGDLQWKRAGPGFTLDVEWRQGTPPLMLADSKTLSDLGVACYRDADDTVITPAIGSMSTGLHPFLALWALLLALSSLARYEPATWSKLIDMTDRRRPTQSNIFSTKRPGPSLAR